MKYEYQPGNVTSGDGVRPWHDLTTSKEMPDGNGFKLWVGNYEKRHDTEKQIKPTGMNIIKAVMAPQAFFIPEIASHQGNCGWFWLGLSRFPHGKNWPAVTAKWSGWTHLVHWRGTAEIIKELPETDLVFFTAHKILVETGYPTNLREFSRILVEDLDLDPRSKLAYDSFAYLRRD